MIHKVYSGEKTSFRISSKKKRLPGEFSEERAARRALQFCVHHLEMLEATVNQGEKRLITPVDLRAYARLCYQCSLAKAKKAFE